MFTNRGKALTFDDILLVPSYSEVTPDMVDVSTWLTPEIQLRIPLLSAAMDTVTESAMAISMARMGGIGVIHKNMSIAQQRLEVERVKKSESGMILDPVTIGSESTVSEALALMHDFRVSGLPVVDNGALKGIITNRDVRFVEDGDAVRVRGVMGIATYTSNEFRVRLDFELLQQYKKELEAYFDSSFDTLSMGMSDDYPLALDYGTTMVRIGSLIFGKRDYAAAEKEATV